MRKMLLSGTGPPPGAAPALGRTGVGELRRRPSHRAELVSQFVMGTRLAVVEERREWRRVVTPDGYRGWTPVEALVELGPGGKVKPRAPRGSVVPLICWVREEARPSAPAIAEVVVGTELPLVGCRRSWWKVGLPSGEWGWLMRRALAPTPRRATVWPPRARVAARALSFRGCPYLWGGTTPKGFDCSGFVQTVFRLEGLLLPRDSWQQKEVARELPPREAPMAGDLLFFGSRGGKVTHVALSLGEGLFVHASGRVRVDSLDPASLRYSSALAQRFLSHGRVLPRRSGGRARRPGHPPAE